MKLTLPYPPYLNAMYVHTKRGVRLSDDAKAFRERAGYMAKEQGATVMLGTLCVTLEFYRPASKGDVDGPIKATLDALNKIAWPDDRHIVELHSYRFDDKANPRVVVTVEQVLKLTHKQEEKG